MLKVCKNYIVFELHLAKKKQRKKDEQNRNFKFGFLNLVKG